MILTIKAHDTQSLKRAIWEAEMMMGLEVEIHSGNIFDVTVFDKDKVDKILKVSNGSVIKQKQH